MSAQLVPALLAPFDSVKQASASGALVIAFHLSKADLKWLNRKLLLFSSREKACLKVVVYASRRGDLWG
jgi:hypothetical protein